VHAYGGDFGGGGHSFDGNASRMFGGNSQSGLSAMERGSDELPREAGNEGGAPGQGGDFGGGRFASGSDMPDTLRVSQAALPTDMGARSGGESFGGYSGSARGLSPVQSKSFDQQVSDGFANVGNAIASAEHEGDVEARGAGRAAQALGDQGRPAGQKIASNVDRPNVANRPATSAVTRADQGRADTRVAAVTRDSGNAARTLQNADANHPIVNGHRASNAAKVADATTRRLSPADMHILGNKIRTDWVSPSDSQFYNAWGGVWLAAQMGAYNPWSTSTWSNLNSWYGNESPPVNYDYGTDLTYENNNVNLFGQPIATTQQYWQSADNLVTQGAQPPPKDAKWLPLGVFEAVRSDGSKPDMLFQLAIDKQATVRGDYYNTADKNKQPIEGAVDKSTQRICWVVEDRKNIVFDTGLYNLTQDETTLLVHFGQDKTEQWTLVRLKQPKKSSGQK
jgi:hypothetical protein